MTTAQLISEYGYAAVFIGCLLEGETMLLIAGYSAHKGYLSPAGVLLLAFAGATLGDQCFFFAGRRYGRAIIARFPSLKPGADRVAALVLRYHEWVIVGVRFMYGLRIVGPLVIGASDIPSWRLLGFNMLGAALWAALIGGAGYFFGETLTLLPESFHKDERVALILLMLLVAGATLWRRLRKRRSPEKSRDRA